MEQITLYYREGSSDKVYQASITPKDGGYVVHFAYGRRGSTLQTGTKTQSPVSLEKARSIYDKLLNEKLGKGYTPGEDGTPYQHTDKANEVSGIMPQLLNAIGDVQVKEFIKDDLFVSQEKFDGRRLLIRKEGATIDAINRKGLLCGLPSPVVLEVREIPGDCIIDGEAVGDVFWVFDILKLHGADLRSQPYRDRLFALNQMVSREFGFLKLADTAHGREEKAALLERMKRENREGVVFKHLDAPYTAGRPNFGGTQFKYKLYATASFIVGKINEKRSVTLKLSDGNSFITVGNVTIPPNHQIPVVGEIVEVRYLYAYRGGSIYQPVYLGARTDITAEDCVISQLKYKAVTEEQAAA
jgi:bifunctional non-homologous end joining protein LigD